jgi:hypothetical protein
MLMYACNTCNTCNTLMASSTKFPEKFPLPSLTQPHKLPREKVSLLLLHFQAINLSIKINKKIVSEREKNFLSRRHNLFPLAGIIRTVGLHDRAEMMAEDNLSKPQSRHMRSIPEFKQSSEKLFRR